MALSGMLTEVTQTRVAGLLLQRRPEVLKNTPEQLAIFEDRVRGAADEVVLLTGPDPVAGSVRNMAIEAIANKVGAELEYALYPEQQILGGDGRGYHLNQEYMRLLKKLEKIISDNGGTVPTDDQINRATSVRPRGRFRDPIPFPDPVQVRGRGSCSWPT